MICLLVFFYYYICRSSHHRCSIKKLFLKIYKKTHVLQSLFNKVGGLKACNFILKRLQHSCFPREYSKIFKTTCFREHHQETTSTIEQFSKNFAMLTGKHLSLLRRCFPVDITIGRNTCSGCFCNLPLTHFMPLIFLIPPKNIRKPEFF